MLKTRENSSFWDYFHIIFHFCPYFACQFCEAFCFFGAMRPPLANHFDFFTSIFHQYFAPIHPFLLFLVALFKKRAQKQRVQPFCLTKRLPKKSTGLRPLGSEQAPRLFYCVKCGQPFGLLVGGGASDRRIVVFVWRREAPLFTVRRPNLAIFAR